MAQDTVLPFDRDLPLKRRIDSPSAINGNHLLDQPIATMCFQPPLSISLGLHLQDWHFLKESAQAHAELVEERQFYSLATSFLPSWVHLVGERTHRSAKMSAEALYPKSAEVYKPLHFLVPWRCEPELFTRAKDLHPGFNGELKSCNAMLFNEVLTYVAIDILHSLFPDNGKHRFYTRPPIGYGLVAFPHVGYFVAVEWVGKLFLTPVTKPFVLGSEDHKAAVERLEDVQYDAYVELPASGGSWRTSKEGDTKLLVKWCATPVNGHFYKILYCERYDGLAVQSSTTRWRDLYRVYARYSEAFKMSSTDRPHALLPARLLFGVSAVLVEMTWAEGVEAQRDWHGDESLVLQVASAIAWLARNKLLYCDPRPPNILVDGIKAYLVDYDDMVLVDRIPKSYDELRSMLEQVADARGERKEVYTLSFEEASPLINQVDYLLKASRSEAAVAQCDHGCASSACEVSSGSSQCEAQLGVDHRRTKRARMLSDNQQAHV